MHGPPKQPCSHALEEVVQSLSNFKLKLAGEPFIDEVWTSDVPIKVERYFQSEAEFDADCKSFWNLKDLLKVVESLNQVLSRKVSQMSNALLPPSRHYGLASIPNETFLRIMDFAAMSCTDYASIMDLMKNLSSVSRRFRGGVIGATSFWNYWDNDYCLDDGFRRRLARTKKASIFLDLFVRSRTSTMKKILKRIMPYKTRCCHLTLQAPWKLEDKFYAEWTFPNISSAKFIGTIPPPGSFPTISSLTLCNKDGEYVHPSEFHTKVTSLLRSMPGLTELDLDVSMVGKMSTRPELSAMELPSVSTFKIGNHRDFANMKGGTDHLTSVSSIGKFVRLFKVPNVEAFFLGLSFYNHWNDGDWVSTTFPEEISFHAARDFHLTVTSKSDSDHELSFEGLSTHFPNLRSLRVVRFMRKDVVVGSGSFCLEDSFDPFDGRFPHLQSFEVSGIRDVPCPDAVFGELGSCDE